MTRERCAERCGAGLRLPRGGVAGGVGAWLVVAATTFAPPARADDDIVAEEPTQQQQQQSVVFFEQQLEGMLGGWQGNGFPAGDRTSAIAGRMLEVDLVTQVCGLDEERKAACVAAAALEAARATEGIDRLRRKYAGRSADLQTPEGQQEWQSFHQEFSAAQATLSPPVFGRSLLSRVIAGVLDEGQAALWEEEVRKRESRQWRLVVDNAMELLDRSVGLDQRQHEAIAGLLLADPGRIDTVRFRNRFGDSPEVLAGWAVTRLADEAVDPILQEWQRARFQAAKQRGAMWMSMLEQWGIVDD